jgi:DNA-binding transcriptional MerR regulator
MKDQSYTVKQLAELAGVGIKTLHHYDEIGLLLPLDHTAAGYRLYGRAELERLQQILFYRALGFPLKTIGKLMTRGSDRLSMLREQRELIRQKRTGFDRLIATLDRTIAAAERGESMPDPTLFEGFRTAGEWNEALGAHNAEMKAKHGADIPPVEDVTEMNRSANEAMAFMSAMAEALRKGLKPGAEEVTGLIAGHLTYLSANGHPTTAAQLVLQTQFFLDDDFHQQMLEAQQVGLSSYLAAAARSFATR